MDPIQRSYDELEETRCLCGLPKLTGAVFCESCLEALPRQLLEQLSTAAPGQAFNDAYAAAAELLRRSRQIQGLAGVRMLT